MATLLTIPRELRDKIIGLVVDSPQQPLPEPNDGEDRVRVGKTIEYGKASYGDITLKAWNPNDVKFRRRLNRVDLIPLLLVNHQLHQETNQVTDRLPVNYILDTMFVNEVEFWPTWIKVPAFRSHINEVYCQMRLCGIFNGKGGSGYSGYRGGCGGPKGLYWGLYYLLETFLLGGIMAGDGSRKGNITIRDLIIDVQRPDVPERMFFREDDDTWDPPAARKHLGIDYIVRPDKFAKSHIAVGLDTIIRSESMDYGFFMFERVGKVKVLADGKLIKEWDMALELFLARNTDRRMPDEKFLAWKEKAYQARVDFGLPVIEHDGGVKLQRT